MSQFDQQWQKLTALARQAPADDRVELPPGFATRVAARASAEAGTSPLGLLERFAFRGFVAAAACCVAAVAFNYFGRGSESSEVAGVEDTVATLLDFS